MVVKGHTQTYGVDHLETSLVASLNFVQICFLLAFLWLKGNISLIFCLKLISSWVLMLLIILWALLLNLILSKDNYILMSVDTGALIVTCTEIFYAVVVFSQYIHAPCQPHYETFFITCVTWRVLLAMDCYMGLLLLVTGFNTDWTGILFDKLSISGYLIL